MEQQNDGGFSQKMSEVKDFLFNPENEKVQEQLKSIDRVAFGLRAIANRKRIEKLYPGMSSNDFVELKVRQGVDTRNAIKEEVSRTKGQEKFPQTLQNSFATVSEIERLYSMNLGDLAVKTLNRGGVKEINEADFIKKCNSGSGKLDKLVFTAMGYNGFGLTPAVESVVREKAIEHFEEGTGFKIVREQKPEAV